MTSTDTDTTGDTEFARPAADFRTPEQEQVAKGAGIAPADELTIDDINPLNANLFAEDRYHRYFERLRDKDPIARSRLPCSRRTC